MTRATIWLITGAPGAGKTTVSVALCRRFPLAVHIPVDDIRDWVRSGFSSPTEWSVETDRQFALARRGAARVAADYADAGFVAVLDDVVRESHLDQYTAYLGGSDLRKVLLSPTLASVLARNATAGRKPFDPSSLEAACRGLHPLLIAENTTEQGWVVVDSTTLDIEETVDAITGQCRAARTRSLFEPARGPSRGLSPKFRRGRGCGARS